MKGKKKHSFTVTLLYVFVIINQALTDTPRFVEPIPNVTVALGRDASLPCVVENLGTYKVAWIHIDRQMILTIHRHVISRIPRFSVSHDNAKTWLLHVSNVHKEDRGYYMCQVNTNPMMSQVGYLQVVVPPNIIDNLSTPSNVAVRENQNISLTCKAEGFPAPKIMWRRGDNQEILVDRKKKVAIFEGENLNLTRISRTEMGVYLCIATNAVPPSVSKRVVVDVEFPPMIWVPNQLVGAPAGTDVTLDCHTEAHPKAISYWVRDNVMLLPTKKYGSELTENSYMAHMKLTVRNLQTIDFGNYRCISKNSLGETEGSIRLYEIPMPTTISRPTEVRSSIRQMAIFEGENLNLTRISRTEMGVYLCIATNAVPPSVSKRVVVDVEFPPMIWVPNQLVGAPAGTDVTLDCHTEAHPKAISYWVRDNVMLLPTKKYGSELTENSYMAHMKLTVRNLQTIDFGNYRCISKNSLGETEGSIRLYEIPMPTTISRPTEVRSSIRQNTTKKNEGKIAPEGQMKSKMTSSSLESGEPSQHKKVETRQEHGTRYHTPSSPQLSGCVSITRWTFPQFAAVILNCFFYQRFV